MCVHVTVGVTSVCMYMCMSVCVCVCMYMCVMCMYMCVSVCVCICVLVEEEISNMRRELDKYGIQMPAFSKIGGMLANEVRQADVLLWSKLQTVMCSTTACHSATQRYVFYLLFYTIHIDY